MGKALVGVPVTQTKSFRQMRAAPAGRRSTKVVAMAGAETAVVVAARWAYGSTRTLSPPAADDRDYSEVLLQRRLSCSISRQAEMAA